MATSRQIKEGPSIRLRIWTWGGAPSSNPMRNWRSFVYVVYIYGFPNPALEKIAPVFRILKKRAHVFWIDGYTRSVRWGGGAHFVFAPAPILQEASPSGLRKILLRDRAVKTHSQHIQCYTFLELYPALHIPLPKTTPN